MIEVLNKITGEPFTEDDVALLTALAGSAAVAIENARLSKRPPAAPPNWPRCWPSCSAPTAAPCTPCRPCSTRATLPPQGHSQRVVHYTLAIARALGITDRDQLQIIQYGALLHDVGKIGVPDAVLHKPGELTPDEWTEMRKHPELGYQMLHGHRLPAHGLPIVRHHHERWDGTGYPAGLAGGHSRRGAHLRRRRRVRRADLRAALSPARSYAEARAMIAADRGTHFDPVVVDAFCQVPEAEWQRSATAWPPAPPTGGLRPPRPSP